MNKPLIQSLYLLAARQGLHRVWGRFDHEGPGAGMNQFLAGAAAFILLVVIALLWRRMTQRPAKTFACDSRPRMFRELCAAHRLGRSDRKLLKRIAAARGLTNPALLFVEPAHWDRASLPTSLRSANAELQRLRAAIFVCA
jgi:hypothetical protein